MPAQYMEDQQVVLVGEPRAAGQAVFGVAAGVNSFFESGLGFAGPPEELTMQL